MKTNALRSLRKYFLQLPRQEATFARRGFHCSAPDKQALLERCGFCFLEGYNAAIAQGYSPRLISRLDCVEDRFRGFAYEGASMGLKLLDSLSLAGNGHFASFTKGEGRAHIYMLHVGAGLAMARLPWRPERFVKKLDPMLGWLAIDGYGFHEGYFHWRRSIIEKRRPRGLRGYRKRVFDQGLGRSLWFVEGADTQRVAARIAVFPESRQADLWAGIGLASAYAGGIGRREMESLANAASGFERHLAQGAAFAAKTRLRAGNPARHTEMACQALCGLSAEQAAAATDSALQDLEAGAGKPDYAAWRRGIRRRLGNRHLGRSPRRGGAAGATESPI